MERQRDGEKDRETRKGEPIVTRTLKFDFLIHSHPYPQRSAGALGLRLREQAAR